MHFILRRSLRNQLVDRFVSLICADFEMVKKSAVAIAGASGICSLLGIRHSLVKHTTPRWETG